jgi:transposase
VSKYVSYAPEQGWLLPPRVIDELGEGHLVFFLHKLIEKADLRAFEAERRATGRAPYPPQMMLKIWLYAYALGLTSSHRIEQLVREDLGFRFLAGNLKPDYWTLNDFRRRHPRGLNDVFTWVVEAAREMGMVKLGRVAIDSTRVEANASADRSDSQEQLRKERARIRQRIRRWHQECAREEQAVSAEQAKAVQEWQRRLEEIPAQLQQLRKSGQKRSSRSDPESRYLKRRGGFCLGYTAEIAVSDDHIVVAQRVHQAAADNGSLNQMTKLIEQQSGCKPQAVVADCGYHAMEEIGKVERRKIAAYVPDRLLAKELAGGEVVEMNERQKRRTPGLAERRERLRAPTAREHQQRRKAVVEPVFGVLKQQRGMRKFRRRGLEAVALEWTLATIAYNVTRMWAKSREDEAAKARKAKQDT